MVGIVLSAEQVKAAPPVVRQWLEQQISADFEADAAPLPAPAGLPAEVMPGRIAACTLPEVMAIFEHIRHDALACRIFLEFGREPVAALHPSPLYAIDLAEITRDTGIASENQLVACLNLINSALQRLRAEPDASLFAVDGNGRCYVQELTHRALHLLRRDLLTPRPPARLARGTRFPITCDPPYRCAEAGAEAAETALPA